MAVDKKLVKIEKRINGRSWAPGEFVGIEFNSPKSPELDEKKQLRKFDGDRIVAQGGGRVATIEEAFALLSRKNFPEHGYSVEDFDKLHKQAEAEAKQGNAKAAELVAMHKKFNAGEAEKAQTTALRANFEQALLVKSAALAS